MKAICFFLLILLVACNNENSGTVPKEQQPTDRTETEQPKDTNRLTGDSAVHPRGAVFPGTTGKPLDGFHRQTNGDLQQPDRKKNLL